MMKKCIECGKSISKEAVQCPQCRSHFPHGISCSVCLGTIQVPKGTVEVPKGRAKIHPECFKVISEVKYTCPVCHKNITDISAACRNCGHPFRVDSCYYCGEGLIVGMDGTKNFGKYDDVEHAHKKCFKSRGENRWW